jgi:hypothetical protein
MGDVKNGLKIIRKGSGVYISSVTDWLPILI